MFIINDKALEYFERLKSDEFGWKLCADCLLSSQSIDESAVFFCLQVIENHVKTRYRLIKFWFKKQFVNN